MCKATNSNDIPVKILKQNADTFLTTFVTFPIIVYMKTNIQISLNKLIYHLPLKESHRDFKESYRHLSILLVIVKIFDELPSKQVTLFIEYSFKMPMCFLEGLYCTALTVGKVRKMETGS